MKTFKNKLYAVGLMLCGSVPMDEMRLESKFTTGLVSKIARTVVRKKLGYDMDIRLNRLRTTVVDEKTHVHLDVDLELTKEELDKLLKSVGL